MIELEYALMQDKISELEHIYFESCQPCIIGLKEESSWSKVEKIDKKQGKIKKNLRLDKKIKLHTWDREK